MASVRELILSRIRNILETKFPVRTYRNADDVTARGGPAGILFDGDEALSDDVTLPRNSRGDPRVLKDFMSMSPSVVVILGSITEIVGTELNAYRDQLIPLVINDASLISYVGANGELRYTGCTVETQSGENREGRITLDFRFRYPLSVLEL